MAQLLLDKAALVIRSGENYYRYTTEHIVIDSEYCDGQPLSLSRIYSLETKLAK